MISLFKPLVSAQRLRDIEEKKTFNAVVRKLSGEAEPRLGSYPLSGGAATAARMRIRELDIQYDPEWGLDYFRDVVWLGAHHAREAADRAERFASHGAFNHSGGSRTTPSSAVAQHITDLCDRVDPALYAAKMEFDPQLTLQREYDRLTADCREMIEAIVICSTEARAGASSTKRRAIRKAEIASLQKVLDSLSTAIRAWAERFPANRQSI